MSAFVCGTCGQASGVGLAWHCLECDSHVAVTASCCPVCEDGFAPWVELRLRHQERERRRALRRAS